MKTFCSILCTALLIAGCDEQTSGLYDGSSSQQPISRTEIDAVRKSPSSRTAVKHAQPDEIDGESPYRLSAKWNLEAVSGWSVRASISGTDGHFGITTVADYDNEGGLAPSLFVLLNDVEQPEAGTWTDIAFPDSVWIDVYSSQSVWSDEDVEVPRWIKRVAQDEDQVAIRIGKDVSTLVKGDDAKSIVKGVQAAYQWCLDNRRLAVRNYEEFKEREDQKEHDRLWGKTE